MVYRVHVYPAGRHLGPVSRSFVYDAETEAEAVVVGTTHLRSAPRNEDPFVFEIFDPDDRLVLSYTSETRSTDAPNDGDLHPFRS